MLPKNIYLVVSLIDEGLLLHKVLFEGNSHRGKLWGVKLGFGFLWVVGRRHFLAICSFNIINLNGL